MIGARLGRGEPLDQCRRHSVQVGILTDGIVEPARAFNPPSACELKEPR